MFSAAWSRARDQVSSALLGYSSTMVASTTSAVAATSVTTTAIPHLRDLDLSIKETHGYNNIPFICRSSTHMMITRCQVRACSDSRVGGESERGDRQTLISPWQAASAAQQRNVCLTTNITLQYACHRLPIGRIPKLA